MRSGEETAASPFCGIWAARKRPTSSAVRTMPSVSGAIQVRTEISPV